MTSIQARHVTDRGPGTGPTLTTKLNELQKLVGKTVTEIKETPQGYLLTFSNGTVLWWRA